jgi:uroporphyrinogen III methyltransferase/synthase
MQERAPAPALLAGQRVMVTRPRDPRDRLATRLTELGAEVIEHPVIRISEPPDWAPADEALLRLERYDWLVFSSANGVRYLVERVLNRAGGLECLKPVRLAAIGPGTAEELGRYGLRADLVPGQYRAEALAEALAAAAPRGRFLLARASRGRETLYEQLTAAGASVEQVVVYTSSDVTESEPRVAKDLGAGRIDWITVTSSAIARNLIRLFGAGLRKTRLATISPLTSATLRELGYEPAVEAKLYTIDGLIEEMVRAV